MNCDLCNVHVQWNLAREPTEAGCNKVGCSGGGHNTHLVCDSCFQMWGFVSVLNERHIKCYVQLNEAELTLLTLRRGERHPGLAIYDRRR